MSIVDEKKYVLNELQLTDHDRVIRLGTNVEELCKNVKLLQKSNEDIKLTIEEFIKEQHSLCISRIDDTGKEFNKRPTWGIFIGVVGGLVTFIGGAYTYTYMVMEKLSTMINKL